MPVTKRPKLISPRIIVWGPHAGIVFMHTYIDNVKLRELTYVSVD